jgi:hypothetical protein
MTAQTACESAGINFSNLTQELDVFPFSCSNGYYLLWDVRLPASEEAEEITLETLLQEELTNLKNKK